MPSGAMLVMVVMVMLMLMTMAVMRVFSVSVAPQGVGNPVSKKFVATRFVRRGEHVLKKQYYYQCDSSDFFRQLFGFH